MSVSVTVSPAGAGTVSQSLEFSWNAPGDWQFHNVSVGDDLLRQFFSGDSNYEIQAYSLTATAADGYTFKHFVTTVTEKITHDGVTTTNTETYYNSLNPAIRTNEGEDYAMGIGYWREDTDNNTTFEYTMEVVAVFESSEPPRPLTHLLVYDPVSDLLVYDPSTNKLVADY